jgi:hypothetical protein
MEGVPENVSARARLVVKSGEGLIFDATTAELREQIAQLSRNADPDPEDDETYSPFLILWDSSGNTWSGSPREIVRVEPVASEDAE